VDDSLAPPSADGGELYLTVSTLIERKVLKKNGELYDAFARERAQKKRRTIEAAVQPMFEDIADRERHIFFDEHLIDAEDASDDAESCHAGSGRPITLEIPGLIRWLTEQQRWQYDAGTCWQLEGVTCRYFWFMHSNRDISYHVSLHIPYRHDARHYYALSLLQKLFFPSEVPDLLQMADSFCMNVVHEAGTPAERRESLTDFLKGQFRAHVTNMLPGHNDGWWEKLAREAPLDANKFLFSPEFSRAAFLLKDDLFDRTLRRPRQALQDLALHSARVRTACAADNKTPARQDAYRDVDVAGLSREGLALIFLSGFLQNIIDFLEQDDLEYHDAIEPLYPTGAMRNDPHFLLYATEDSIFEIVSSSRSLEKGSQYIGTCPYLFLVHVTVFHDESLVRRFANSVRKLTKRIGKKTEKFSNFDASIDKLDKIVSIFHKGRFGIFGEVERYRHINTFLYSTEQSFYKAISDYRYIEGRLQHWNDMLNELSNATSGAHELARQKTERRMDRVLFYIASFSIFQVLFAITQSIAGWRFGSPDSEPDAARGAVNGFKYFADFFDVGLMIVAIGFAVFATTEYLTRKRRR
jgi:hypothetical protein